MLIRRKGLTIFVPTSRPDRVEAMAKNIHNLALDDTISEPFILIVCDNNLIPIEKFQRAYTREYKRNALRVVYTGNGDTSLFNIQDRRRRIADVFNLAAKNLPRTSHILTIEDDTNFSYRSLLELTRNYDSLVNQGIKVGFISGVQAGRWGVKMIGAWDVDNYDKPTNFKTIEFTRAKLLQSVTAAGFYFYLTTRKLFKAVDYRFGAFGPDVFWGMDIASMGYRNYVNWTVKCPHITPDGAVIVDSNCVSIEYNLIDNEWKRIR